MRNQPIPACKGGVLYTGIRRSCAGYDFSVRSGHSAKAKPDLPKRRNWPGDPWALHQATRLQEQTTCRPCPSSCSGKLNPKKECCTGRFCWLMSFACLLCSPRKEAPGEWDKCKECAQLVTVLWVVQNKSLGGCSFFNCKFLVVICQESPICILVEEKMLPDSVCSGFYLQSTPEWSLCVSNDSPVI